MSTDPIADLAHPELASRLAALRTLATGVGAGTLRYLGHRHFARLNIVVFQQVTRMQRVRGGQHRGRGRWRGRGRRPVAFAGSCMPIQTTIPRPPRPEHDRGQQGGAQGHGATRKERRGSGERPR